MEDMMELSIDHIRMSYDKGKTWALDDVCGSMQAGVYGLLGPNGAGKSTLMNIMTTNLRPTEGKILLDGKDIFNMGGAYRAMLGYAPQQQKLYDDWTGDQFLWYMAALKGIPRRLAGEKIGQVLQLVNLTDVQYRKMKTYSGGMRQRILIAQSLLGDPQILILDEPTAGLDPSERAHIRDFIKTVAGEKIVLISTHVVSDIESIANEVILLERGRVLRWDTTEHLIREIPGARGLEDVYLSLMGDTLQFTRHQTSVNGQRYQER